MKAWDEIGLGFKVWGFKESVNGGKPAPPVVVHGRSELVE